MRSGGGHHQNNANYVTLGALGDFLEAVLLIGCTVQVTFFPAGGSAEDDSSANEREKSWQRSPKAVARGFPTTLPRLRVHSQYVWPGEGPSMYQRFDVSEGVWVIRDELNFTTKSERERRKYEVYDRNGTHWLAVDCQHDNEEADWRWSRSDGWEGLSLHTVASRMSCSSSKRTRRLRERVRRLTGYG